MGKLPKTATSTLLLSCLLCLSACEGTNTGWVLDHATDNPVNFVLTPLAVPGAMIEDVLTGGQGPDSPSSSSDSTSSALDTGNAILGLGNAALGGYNAGRSTGSYSGGNETSSSANSSLCQQYRSMAQQCYSNWQGLGGGSSGQAGDQYDCYKQYTNAANSC